MKSTHQNRHNTRDAVTVPAVSIVIVSYNNPSDVHRCLEALSESSYLSFEVIICENGGKNAFDRLFSLLPPTLPSGQTVTMICAPVNLGFAGGVNLAISHASKTTDLWILNPDTLPHKDALFHLIERLHVGDCDAIGCSLILPSGRVQSYGGHWSNALAHATSIGYGSNPDKQPTQQIIEAHQNYLNGASMLITRAFIDFVGPMREDYFLYCEEVEWCLRARAMGMKLGFSSEAWVLHSHGTTTGIGEGFGGASKITIYLGERNRLLVLWDCAPRYLPVAIFSSLGRFLTRCIRSRAMHHVPVGLQGWFAGIRNQRILAGPAGRAIKH